MPIPNPKSEESENEYVSRCMEAIGAEYDDPAKSIAICYSTYRREEMSKIRDTASKVMARVKYNTDFRGINLLAEQGDDPCTSGYTQYGMKDLGGREVPNCIPNEGEE